ncbi:MAG: hypothetical protein ILA15_02990 [Clostridiales bacterium]|nr:hypothetical protein [Clostridiales bacterium]
MRKARRVRLFRNLFTAVALTIVVVLTGCSWPTQPTFVTVASQDPQAIQPGTISVSLESSAADTTETTDLYMATEQLDFSDYVFVGDSRTVGMGQVLHLDTIAEIGVGYSFLAAHREEILEYSGKNIVFNLGVNDLAHIDDYIEFFQRLPEEFCFDNNIYVVSVNPTSGAYSSMNGDIDYFNVQLSDSLPSTCKWIDTCSFLREAGFGSTDGLHYDQQTYELIANLIYNNVQLYQSLGY